MEQTTVEIFKQICETAKSLGDSARVTIIWYLALTYLKSYIVGILWSVGGIYCIIKFIDLLKIGFIGSPNDDKKDKKLK